MIYADTSALIKRYLSEAGSDDFDALFLAQGPFSISRLTFVEMRCALDRRRRGGQINATLETAALTELRTDIQDGALSLNAMADRQVTAAFHLIEAVSHVPLRTLDALHLAIARDIAASGLATADRNQADAAEALGFTVFRFH